MARTVAKRRSEPGRARVFLLLMSCGYCESPQKHQIHKASHSVGLHSVAIAPSLRARILGGEPTGGFVAARLHHRLLSFAPIGA